MPGPAGGAVLSPRPLPWRQCFSAALQAQLQDKGGCRLTEKI